MRSKDFDGSQERQILTALIVDKSVLSRVAANWKKEGLFRSKWSNLIASWCVSYFSKYGSAPGPNIQRFYERWARKANDEKLQDLVATYLESLSDEYSKLKKESNSDFVLDTAADYFNKVKLQRLGELIEEQLERGASEKLLAEISKFGRMEFGVSSAIDVLLDEQAIEDAFAKQSESLIKYDGALGRFFGGDLARECLFAFMGVAKTGKTFWLMDLAWRAMLQKKKTVLFGLGDMSRGQMLLRFAARAARKPIKPCTIKYPKKMERTEDGVVVRRKKIKFERGLTLAEAKAKLSNAQLMQVGSDESYLKLYNAPTKTLTVAGAKAYLNELEKDGWIPDVVVFDYADILAPPEGVPPGRDQVNEKWVQLRALSHEKHCLVVAGTQADASAYRKGLLSRENFTEDRRINDHVTGMVGLNRTLADEDQGIYRLNWLDRREDIGGQTRIIRVAECLGIANPAVLSLF